MTAVVPYSEALEAELEALGPEVRRHLRARRHYERRFAVLTSKTWEADKALTALVARYGRAQWAQGRWHVFRPQLRLPGM